MRLMLFHGSQVYDATIHEYMYIMASAESLILIGNNSLVSPLRILLRILRHVDHLGNRNSIQVSESLQ